MQSPSIITTLSSSVGTLGILCLVGVVSGFPSLALLSLLSIVAVEAVEVAVDEAEAVVVLLIFSLLASLFVTPGS